MDNLNLKQILLKKPTDTENIGDLDNKERCLYIYFPIGNNHNLSNSIIEKNAFTVTVSLPSCTHPK